jgi:ParB family chromosome partitioning protein
MTPQQAVKTIADIEKQVLDAMRDPRPRPTKVPPEREQVPCDRNDIAAAPATGSSDLQPRSQSVTPTVCTIELADILDSPYQPRQRPITRKDVAELMRAIAAAGQVTPIIVSPASGEQSGKYFVHSGHRRCAALRFLGAQTVLAVVRTDLDDRAARKLALADNLGRDDLSAWEQATALKAYCDDYNVGLKDGARELGIRLRTAERLKTIIECSSEPILRILRDSNVAIKAADLLVRIDKRSPRKGSRLARKWLDGKASQKDLEAALRTVERGPGQTRSSPDVVLKNDGELLELRIRLDRHVHTQEQIRRAEQAISVFAGYIGLDHIQATCAEEVAQ